MSVTLESLQEEIVHLKADIHTLQRQQSSRKGDPGPKGDSVQGLPGRDAVLRIVADAKENVVHIFDEKGVEQATVVTVPGKPGRDGADSSVQGPKGDPGRAAVAPSIEEVVRGVLQAVKAKL